MASSGLKQAFLAFLFLAFLNQWAAASTMHCVSATADAHPSHTKPRSADVTAEDPHHAHHGHHSDEPMAMGDLPLEKSFDCCKTNDHCFSGGCLVPPIAPDLVLSSAQSQLTLSHVALNTSPTSPISSLYRPPIFR